MRTYRVELTGETYTFATYFKAHNEYEAKEQARDTYKGFAVTHIVEVMTEEEE